MRTYSSQLPRMLAGRLLLFASGRLLRVEVVANQNTVVTADTSDAARRQSYHIGHLARLIANNQILVI